MVNHVEWREGDIFHLDEGAIVSDPAWSDQMRNVAAALFRLEHNRDEQDMLAVLGTLVEWLKAPEQTGLRRAFVVWIRRVLLPSRAPEIELPDFTDLQDLHEVHDMLAERIKKWPEQWEERGRQATLREAEERVLENKRNAARRLIARTEMNNQLIAEIAELPVEEIEKLRAETQH